MLVLPLMIVSSMLAFSEAGVLQIYDDGINFPLSTAARDKVQDELTSLIQGIQPRYVYNAGCSFGFSIPFPDNDKKSIHLSLFFYAPEVCGPQFNSVVEYATGQDLRDRFRPLVPEVLELIDNEYGAGYVVSEQFQVGYSLDTKMGCTTLKRNLTTPSEAHCYGFDSILMGQSAFNTLYAGCQLESPNKKYALKMTLDCKLLLVEAATNVTVWSASYNGAGQSGCFLTVQDDWNLVVYNGSHNAMWVPNGFYSSRADQTRGNVWLEVGSNRGLSLYLTVSGVQMIWSSDESQRSFTDDKGNFTMFPVSRANVTDDCGGGKSKASVIVLSSVLPLGVILLCLLFIVLWQQRQLRRKKVEAEISKAMAQSHLANYSFKMLELATQGFHPRNKLGQGAYGVVYRGIIPTVGAVAIKQLKVLDEGQVDFVNEVSTISSLQHKNLIKLIGFCYQKDHRLLVYEYLENNSLHQALHATKLHLPWKARYEICVEVAKGIAYLHEESRTRIVHRDIKASNILLDNNLSARISDFGLARFMRDSATHLSTRVAGTFGYLAPEYALYGHVTEKVDVYSFGILTLELLSGRENLDFNLPPEQSFILEWAWRLYEEDQWIHLVDQKIVRESTTLAEVRRVFMVSLLCTQTDPTVRPAMSRVVGMLTGDIELAAVDLSRPGYLLDIKQAARNKVNQN